MQCQFYENVFKSVTSPCYPTNVVSEPAEDGAIAEAQEQHEDHRGRSGHGMRQRNHVSPDHVDQLPVRSGHLLRKAKEKLRIWMDMNGDEWTWKDMKGYEWIWMDMNGYEWIWMDMNGYEWIWKDMNGYEWIWMNMNEYEWKWMLMNGYEWIWMDMNGYQWISMKMNG